MAGLRSITVVSLLVGLIFCAGVPAACAHGFRGRPVDPYSEYPLLPEFVGPDPADPPPPPAGPAGPGGPPPDGPLEVVPLPPPPPGLLRVGPPKTASPGKPRRVRKPPLFNSWVYWWIYNQDECLGLTQRRRECEGLPIPTGRSGRPLRGDLARQIRQLVLEPGARGSVQAEGLIALGRAGPHAPDADWFLPFLEPGRAECVRAAAAIALGLQGRRSDSVRTRLLEIVADSGEAASVRARAALSLGLLRDASREVIECLQHHAGDRDGPWDVRLCAITAFGFMDGGEVMRPLLGLLASGLGSIGKAHVVTALGRLGDAEAVPHLLPLLKRRHVLTRRSTWMALGRLLPEWPGIGEILPDLGTWLKREPDLTARSFALISLGRIAGGTSVSTEGRQALLDRLLLEFETERRSATRPFAALGLGLAGRGCPDEAPVLAEILGFTLHSERGKPEVRGAIAIALGLLGEAGKGALRDLCEVAADPDNDLTLRGYAMTALGMIGTREARISARAAFPDFYEVSPSRCIGVTGVLLQDWEAGSRLVESMYDPRPRLPDVRWAGLALGRYGTIWDTHPLLLIAGAYDLYSEWVSSELVAALGDIIDPLDVPVLARLAAHHNWRAATPVFDDLLRPDRRLPDGW